MRVAIISAVALLLGGCGSGTDAPVTSTSSALSAEPSGLVGEPSFVTPLEDAVSVNVAAGFGTVVAWITHDAVSVATVDVSTGALADVEKINGDLAPFAHPIERPAVRVGGEGDVDVAFTALAGSGATVYFSEDLSLPEPISGPPRPETNLVHMTTTPDGSPLLAWLEDSTLSVARSDGGSLTEFEGVDDLTCDCCNPVPVVTDDSLVVAYRDRDTVDGEIVRNVAAIRSLDGGDSYESPVEVADDDWFLNGCPFTGPDLIEIEGALVVAWMDARQSVHPNQADSTIWVDRSLDGGATFGTDQAVAANGRHRWPVMTVDSSGVIHLIWETQGPEGGLSYSWSEDQGETFSEPELLVDRAMSDGRAPTSPSVVYHEGHVVVSWANGVQGYVAAWPTG